ncbi:unnamed protein product [Mytilus coruscus]|uniref:PML C-terminal domain-containing protein n=1 Tax=Mytilus coruscus TaxID=42192 RepID=A0A6J8CD49_MYTCO|nr:unnamed protein product [Mytilus coruscus]
MPRQHNLPACFSTKTEVDIWIRSAKSHGTRYGCQYGQGVTIKGANITAIIGDEDTTTIARLRCKSRTSHITQISARRGLETFSKYILPAREITPKAGEVTGLTFQNGSLYLLDKIVPAVGMLDDKVVTKRTANCIARSGLNLSHLRLAYSRNGRTGIKDILVNPVGPKPE